MKALITGASSGIGKEVAIYAIDNMFKGKYIILPGVSNKAIRFLSKIVPDKLIGKIIYNMEEAREDKK